MTTKLGGLLDFLDSDERRRCSKPIRCNGLSWHLLFKHIAVSGCKRHLGVYLCHDITELFGYNFHHWSANVTFALKLVNHDQEKSSKTEETSHVFEKNSVHCRCFGLPRFISDSDLYSGFVKQDAIDFEVQFKGMEVDLI